MTYAATTASAASRRGFADSRILFCDFDGPIADVSERYYATYCRCLEQMQRAASVQVRCLSQPQFWTFKQNRVPDRQIALWSGLNGSDIDQFLSLVASCVNATDLLAYDQPQPQAPETLARLNQLGFRIIIVTLRSPTQVNQFLHDHALTDTVSEVYGCGHIEAAYANRSEHKIALLRRAIAQQKLQGYDPRGCFMVGDTEADILAGQAANLPTIALSCGIRSRRYLRTFRPTHLQPCLAAAVDHVIVPALVEKVAV